MSTGYWSWCPTCGKDEKCIQGICQKCGRGPDGKLAQWVEVATSGTGAAPETKPCA